MMRSRFALSVLLLVLIISRPVLAGVTDIEVTSRQDLLGGREFATVGAYQSVTATVHFALDPKSLANWAIVDLDHAPRAPDGKVHFSADLFVLTPKDPSRGAHVALVDVLNRGRKNLMRDFNLGAGAGELATEADIGDGFLMNQGLTLVWVGWQFDIPARRGLLGVQAPPVLINGAPVTGEVRTSFVPNSSDSVWKLDDLARYADTTRYTPLNLAGTANRLTVRQGYLGQPRLIAGSAWRFAREQNGALVPDPLAVHLTGGFSPGMVYELRFPARGAVVGGVGFAAVRDLAAYLKNADDILPRQRAVLAYGPSQDGRFLREFLYEGFNADEQGGRALDGVIANIAGSSRGADFNTRFARPNGLAFFDAALFPYLDTAQHDPLTGRVDGIQMHLAPAVRPKIFYTNSSGEYWGGGRAAALIHTSLDGRGDIALPENVRAYLFAGTQHIPGGYLASQGPGALAANPNPYAWPLRALLVAMQRWVQQDAAPPRSAIPRLADATLVPATTMRFPTIPGVASPRGIPAGYRADLADGQRHRLPLLVPAVDGDGNERAGIRMPAVAAPLGTYTGWNFRNASIGQPQELLPLTGSFIPFAQTRTARERAGDPRLAIDERYGNRAEYETIARRAADALVAQGYLLADDVPRIVAQTLTTWDALAGR